MAHDLTDFQADVITRSREIPVLVDFWADWCGPCKLLGPIVEKLAAEAAGRWMLVKIDTEAHPDLAARFGIRGIPNLKLFHHGEVIAELGGALPEPQLRAWLDEHLPSPARAAMTQALSLLQAGCAGEAQALLQPLLATAPGNHALILLHARAMVFTAPDLALTVLESLPDQSALQDDIRIVRAFAAAAVSLQHAGRLPAKPWRERYLAGLRHLLAQEFHAAAENLVDVLLEDPGFDQGTAKAVCLALFKHLGLHHPTTGEFFRRYSMAVNS